MILIYDKNIKSRASKKKIQSPTKTLIYNKIWTLHIGSIRSWVNFSFDLLNISIGTVLNNITKMTSSMNIPKHITCKLIVSWEAPFKLNHVEIIVTGDNNNNIAKAIAQ